MPEKTEKQIIVSTEVLAKESTQTLQTLSTSIFFVVNSVEAMIQANMRLQMSNIAVRNSEWAVVDAERARQRLAISNVDLMRQQATLDIAMSERQLAITQRTGRRLDVMQAQLNTEKALTNAQLVNYDIETNRVKIMREAITAEEQHNMALRQQSLMYVSVFTQIAANIIQTQILIALMWAKISAMIAERGIATVGATVALDLAVVGAATYGISKYAMSTTTPAQGPSYSNTTVQNNTTINGNVDQGTYNRMQDNQMMYQSTGGGIRRRAGT